MCQRSVVGFVVVKSITLYEKVLLFKKKSHILYEHGTTELTLKLVLENWICIWKMIIESPLWAKRLTINKCRRTIFFFLFIVYTPKALFPLFPTTHCGRLAWLPLDVSVLPITVRLLYFQLNSSASGLFKDSEMRNWQCWSNCRGNCHVAKFGTNLFYRSFNLIVISWTFCM